jgi:hypothetical protein
MGEFLTLMLLMVPFSLLLGTGVFYVLYITGSLASLGIAPKWWITKHQKESDDGTS